MTVATRSLANERAAVIQQLGVSRETEAKLDIVVAELVRWQAMMNLVGPATLPQVWSRHIADSWQLLNCCGESGPWIDLGSGGGFPGLMVAIGRTEQGLGTTHLIESNSRKCGFLRQVIRLTDVDAVVHEGRIDAVLPRFDQHVAVVSARAVASLDQLLGWTNQLLRKGALGIFPKGQDVELEVKQAAISWDFSASLQHSKTDPHARIVLVRMDAMESASHERRR